LTIDDPPPMIQAMKSRFNMTAEQEIGRIKRDFKEHWPKLETHPEIQQALAEENPVKLVEAAAKIIYGTIWVPTKQEIEEQPEFCYPRRKVTAISKLDADWEIKVGVEYQRGNEVDVTDIKCPNDIKQCVRVALNWQAKWLLKPDKIIFFIRHPDTAPRESHQ
jgi:hypothetical protein